MAANVKVDFDPVPPSLVVKEIIGQGSHCVVYRGELDSKPVVVKKIREKLLNFVDFHKFKVYCDRMKNVRHPNVIEFMGVYREKRRSILVMELMRENLDMYLKRNREQLPAERSSTICCSVCEGLAYLHKANIPVTLSSEKIFLNKHGEVKLAYFDLSNLLKKDSRRVTGSRVHAHPKVVRGIQVPATTVDSYSLGVLLLKICTQQPFSLGVDTADTGARQHEHNLKQLEDTHPFKPIIAWCLQHEILRPSVDVVCHHVGTIPGYVKKIDDLKNQKIALKDLSNVISEGYIQVKSELESARERIVSLVRRQNLLRKEPDKYRPTQLVVNPSDDHMKCAPVPEKPILKHHSLSSDLLPATAVNTVKYYIAVEDIPLPKLNQKPVVSYAEQEEIQDKQTFISRGELLVSEGATTGDQITARLAFGTSQQFTCPKSSVVPVTDEEYQLLAPIKCLPDRLALSKNKDTLLALAKLKVEDRVRVTILLELGSPSISLGTTSCAATVKYIGEIEGEVGRHFGVQIEEPLGDCSGTFNDSQYFICDYNHGLFPASQLNVTRKPPDTPHRQEVHVTLGESVYGHVFDEGEEVYIVGKDGRRTPGEVKWASPSATARKHSHIKMKVEESSTSGQDKPELDISEVDVTVVPEVTPPCPPHHLTTVPERTHSHPPQPTTTVQEETESPALPEPVEWFTADEEEVIPEGSLSHSPLLPAPPPASHSFTVGSLVMVQVGRREAFGTIRWIGGVPNSDEQMAGIELDVHHRGCGSGDYEGVTYFECDKGHGKFVPVSKLRPDPRFVEEPQGINHQYYS